MKGQRVQGGDEMFSAVGFENEPTHTCAKQIQNELLAIMHREDKDFDAWKFSFQRMRQIQPVQSGSE